MAVMLHPIPKYVLQSEPAPAGAGEKCLLVWENPIHSCLVHS